MSAREQAAGFWARRGVALAYVCGLVLSLPSLGVPLFNDDFLQRLVLEGAVPELGLDAATLYDFSRGGMDSLCASSSRPTRACCGSSAVCSRVIRCRSRGKP